ncbi:MAG TPA: preprotein translocase subunit YajC [Gemmataceae bacterium]|jgi:preprotein translocase subunit YajC|nr:preprotein translocase subunit YajC [Gemmataceae bacterium]
MWYSLLLLAQGEPAKDPGWYGMLLPLGLLFLFYFVLWRPMRKQDQERKALLSSLKKNDEIITSSGIYGTVVAVSDTEDEMTVKVADNVRIRVLKSGVARNLTNEKAAREGKDTGTAITTGPNTSVTGGKPS